MKPTDLWGKYPGKLRMPCAPHHSSPRGKSIMGEEVRDAAERARMPYALGKELLARIITYKPEGKE